MALEVFRLDGFLSFRFSDLGGFYLDVYCLDVL